MKANSLMKMISAMSNVLLYPLGRTIVQAQSIVQWSKTRNLPTKTHFEAEYDGQPLVLIALYQKGELRPDLMRLIDAAKAQGFYVLGVNTLKHKNPSALEGKLDCYIERPNFGRDFGSYKSGFQHVFSRGWEKTCPRLLMINDSVYYSSRGLDKFLSDLMSSQTEVLGGTENYEIEYHLGSFCISMAQSILQAKAFREYWEDYRLTDVRPKVIKRGEMKLSKTLKRCCSEPGQFDALYSAKRFMKEIYVDTELQNQMIQDGRTSALTHWKRFDPKKVLSFVSEKHFVGFSSLDPDEQTGGEDSTGRAYSKIMISDRQDISDYLLRDVKETNEAFDTYLDDAIASLASEAFMEGSQIHQNAAVLLWQGLPIIKLDGLYRGMFNTYDVLKLKGKLNELEAEEMGRLLMDRPFGGNTLIGWKRAAFLRGLI